MATSSAFPLLACSYERTDHLAQRWEELGVGDRRLKVSFTLDLTDAHFEPSVRSEVGAGGFEPPTSRSRSVRAAELRYAP